MVAQDGSCETGAGNEPSKTPQHVFRRSYHSNACGNVGASVRLETLQTVQWGTSANRSVSSPVRSQLTPHSNAHTHTRMKPSRSSVSAYSSIAPCGSAHRRPAVLSPYLCTVSCVPLSRTARLRARSPQPISQGGALTSRGASLGSPSSPPFSRPTGTAPSRRAARRDRARGR